MSENIHQVSVNLVIEKAQILVKNYNGFVAHAPKMLRQSMMLAYTTAVDDMLKVLDSARIDPVTHEERSPIVLLDENGHAT